MYVVTTVDGYTVPSACFNPNLIQPLNGLCEPPNNYVVQAPTSVTPSFIDLRGIYLQADLMQDNFAALLTSALQRTGFSLTGKTICSSIASKNVYFNGAFATFSLVSSILAEARFGLDMSLITRIYYIVLPNQIINQEQIQAQLRVSGSELSFPIARTFAF